MYTTLFRHVGRVKVLVQPRHVVGIILVIVIVALSLSNCHYSNRANKAEGLYLQQSGNAAANRTHSEGVRTVIEERYQAHEKAEAVLEQHPEWSAQPLPPDVADLLRNDSNTSRSVP